MSRTVLLVDDSSAVRWGMALVLKRAGYQCLEAADGKEAISVLSEKHVDVVLSDLWMPMMDGLGLVRSIRANERLRFLPVLIVTTDVDSTHMSELRSAGATGIVNKPVPPAELVALVDSTVS